MAGASFDRPVVVGGGRAGGLHMHGTPMLNVHGQQAAAIADEAAITGGQSPTEAAYNALVAKLNTLLAACRGVALIAS